MRARANSYLFALALKEQGIPFAHYVFPNGFHGLSVASKSFFEGRFGTPYTMEQVERAVQAVKAGKGVNVSEQRRAELEAQFPDKPATQKASAAPANNSSDLLDAYGDVRLWITLATKWLERL